MRDRVLPFSSRRFQSPWRSFCLDFVSPFAAPSVRRSLYFQLFTFYLSIDPFYLRCRRRRCSVGRVCSGGPVKLSDFLEQLTFPMGHHIDRTGRGAGLIYMVQHRLLEQILQRHSIALSLDHIRIKFGFRHLDRHLCEF